MSAYDDPRDEEIGPFYALMCRAGCHEWCDSLRCECDCGHGEDEHGE